MTDAVSVRLTFSVVVTDEPSEIDMMREQIGAYFDASNSAWEFYDLTLNSIEPESTPGMPGNDDPDERHNYKA